MLDATIRRIHQAIRERRAVVSLTKHEALELVESHAKLAEAASAALRVMKRFEGDPDVAAVVALLRAADGHESPSPG